MTCLINPLRSCNTDTVSFLFAASYQKLFHLMSSSAVLSQSTIQQLQITIVMLQYIHKIRGLENKQCLLPVQLAQICKII